MLLDTGSSTVAFCNVSLPEDMPATKTHFNACEQYGPSTANGNFGDGYVGPFFQGELRIQGSSELQIPNAMFAVFGEGSCAPFLCKDHPSQGIFGVAYRQRNKIFPSTLDLSSACLKTSSNIDMLCPSTSASFVPPLMQELRQTSDGSEIFGIYWSGGAGGSLYLGPPAVETRHFDPSAPRAALLDSGAGASGWYNVNVLKLVVGGIEYEGIDCTKHSRACIIDTGTPTFLLPAGVSLDVSSFPQEMESQKLEFHLQGATGEVVLHFDLGFWLSQGLVGTLNPPEAFWDPLLVLGLPLWADYYTMFNLTANTVSFTRQGS
eukprot:Skav208997  [mRNA]  locus=scaffold2686:171740:172699:- [translate_table: standard]